MSNVDAGCRGAEEYKYLRDGHPTMTTGARGAGQGAGGACAERLRPLRRASVLGWGASGKASAGAVCSASASSLAVRGCQAWTPRAGLRGHRGLAFAFSSEQGEPQACRFVSCLFS